MSYGTVGGHWASEQGIQTKRLMDQSNRQGYLNSVKAELDSICENQGKNQASVEIQLMQCNGRLLWNEAVELLKFYK